MPMPTDAPEPSPDAQDPWLALTASELGAAHRAAGLPNQDAVAARQIRPDALVAAVADGHGHRRHFRSGRGSQLAVAVACEAAQELGARLDDFEAAGQIESEALNNLVPAITGRWREAVRADVAADPFTAREEALRSGGDDALIAYGSTLLLAIAGRRWLVLAQIGDGDIVGIRPDGQALLPVPPDPSLDGQQTTSLCGSGAEDDFRAAVVDTSATALVGVLLATDGYGNAQAADPWAEVVCADLAELIADRPPEWLVGQLPLWAGRCASADGSADDTTIALLIAPSATDGRRAAPREPAAGQVTTVVPRQPAEPATEPSSRIDLTREQRPAEPARFAPPRPAPPRPAPAEGRRRAAHARAGRSRRLVLIAAAVVVIALAAFLAFRLSSSSGTKPISCNSPSAGTGKLAQASATGGAVQHPTANATAVAVGPRPGGVSSPCGSGSSR
jgi:Protein phosphatase 2C